MVLQRYMQQEASVRYGWAKTAALRDGAICVAAISHADNAAQYLRRAKMVAKFAAELEETYK